MSSMHEQNGVPADPGQSAPGRRLALVVDDEPYVAVVIAAILERSGFRVLAAEGSGHAREVLADLRARGVVPDVAIIDLHMPGESGVELARWCADGAADSPMPVVLLTGQVEALDLDLPANVRVVMHKPVTKRTLLGEVHRLLGLAAAGEAA